MTQCVYFMFIICICFYNDLIFVLHIDSAHHTTTRVQVNFQMGHEFCWKTVALY
jgi:hypothetical protein